MIKNNFPFSRKKNGRVFIKKVGNGKELPISCQVYYIAYIITTAGGNLSQSSSYLAM